MADRIRVRTAVPAPARLCGVHLQSDPDIPISATAPGLPTQWWITHPRPMERGDRVRRIRGHAFHPGRHPDPPEGSRFLGRRDRRVPPELSWVQLKSERTDDGDEPTITDHLGRRYWMAGVSARTQLQDPLAGPDNEAAGPDDALCAWRTAPPPSARRRRADLRHRRRRRGRVWHGDRRERGLPSRRLRPYRHEQERRNGAGRSHRRYRAGHCQGERAVFADLHAERTAVDRGTPGSPPEANLGGQGHRAPRAAGAIRARGDTPA